MIERPLLTKRESQNRRHRMKLHLETFNFCRPTNISSRACWLPSILVVVALLVATGCSERRYRPAAWQSSDENTEVAQSTAPMKVPSQGNSTLPQRSSSNSTLPNRNSGKATTLPNRASRNTTLPNRSTTLPQRAGSRNSTLPARSTTLPQREPRSLNRGSTLPQ